MRTRSLPRKLYDWWTHQWFLTTFVLTVSANWFLLMRLAGETVGAVDSSGHLTPFGHLVTWPLFAASVIFAVIKTLADKYDYEGKKKAQNILQRLLESANDVTRKKASRFVDFIVTHAGQTDLDPFPCITQPRKQIEYLVDNMQGTLAELFGVSRDIIGIGVICRCGQHSEWKSLYAKQTDEDLTVDELVRNPSTTARQIIDGKEKLLFFPDKRVGHERQAYVFGLRDRACHNIGSVYCRDLSVGRPCAHMEAVLSVTTYGQQLCKSDDFDAIEKIQTIVMPPFEDRLKLELALHFIKEHMAGASSQQGRIREHFVDDSAASAGNRNGGLERE
jgi:hypothetical protein